MDHINIRVLIKEPRGFIRILQVLFSVLAWSTTAGFTTTSSLHIDCPEMTPFTVDYKIAYPFDLRQTEVSAPKNCTDDVDVVQEVFPIDFSCTSMLYVLVCFISLVYALGAAAYYSILTAKYETDPLAPMVDLCLTILVTVFWVVINCTWALNVSDLKHYTHPHYFKEWLDVCQDSEANCQTATPGKWTSLTVSIICGFTCVILWLASTWFIFKETTLHKKQASYQQQGPGSTIVSQQQQQQQAFQPQGQQQTGI